MMTPPATCDSQASLLMIRPQSCTATIFVHLTTPVSVSTQTSATCTPPTWTLERLTPSFFAWASLRLQVPLPLTCYLPSRAHTFFHSYSLLAFLSRTLPGMISRSDASALSLPATFSKSASRAFVAAMSVAGAWVGQVVLPPEPCDRP